MSQIAAIIITHNSADVIDACLASTSGVAEVVVVDNASADDTLEKVRNWPECRLIANESNRGFGAAVNQGAAESTADLLLILNPDVQIQRGIEALAKACREHGLASGTLTDSDGVPQAGFTIRRLPTVASLCFEVLGLNRMWPGNPVNAHYRYRGRDLDREGPAEQPAGAFLMVRRDIFDELGGFDEAFFPVWFEDVDLAKRAFKLGYRAHFTPNAVARHLGGHSVGRLPLQRRELYWYASLLRYTAKHFGTQQFRVVSLAVATGCLIRFVAGIVLERKVRAVYWTVIHLALKGLVTGQLCSGMIDKEKRRTLGERRSVQVETHPAQR